mmetsp:Transcript_1369/g.2136  ORF Transcript_1369/g.2136 Transcript_1369/m.2136 type:complete len:91 (+) Transcript_1369:1443-1715(+)
MTWILHKLSAWRQLIVAYARHTSPSQPYFTLQICSLLLEFAQGATVLNKSSVVSSASSLPDFYKSLHLASILPFPSSTFYLSLPSLLNKF